MLCAAKIEKVTFNRLLKHKIVRVINKRSRWMWLIKLESKHAWLCNGPMSSRSKYCKQFLNSFILSFSFFLSFAQDNFVAFSNSTSRFVLVPLFVDVVHWSWKRNKAIFHSKWERNFAANECIWNVINSCPACMQMTVDKWLRTTQHSSIARRHMRKFHFSFIIFPI